MYGDPPDVGDDVSGFRLSTKHTSLVCWYTVKVSCTLNTTVNIIQLVFMQSARSVCITIGTAITFSLSSDPCN